MFVNQDATQLVLILAIYYSFSLHFIVFDISTYLKNIVIILIPIYSIKKDKNNHDLIFLNFDLLLAVFDGEPYCYLLTILNASLIIDLVG
jgi:hypothetical protein